MGGSSFFLKASQTWKIKSFNFEVELFHKRTAENCLGVRIGIPEIIDPVMNECHFKVPASLDPPCSLLDSQGGGREQTLEPSWQVAPDVVNL